MALVVLLICLSGQSCMVTINSIKVSENVSNKMLKDSKTPYVFLHWEFLQVAVNLFLTFGVYFGQKKPGKLAV